MQIFQILMGDMNFRERSQKNQTSSAMSFSFMKRAHLRTFLDRLWLYIPWLMSQAFTSCTLLSICHNKAKKAQSKRSLNNHTETLYKNLVQLSRNEISRHFWSRNTFLWSKEDTRDHELSFDCWFSWTHSCSFFLFFGLK